MVTTAAPYTSSVPAFHLAIYEPLPGTSRLDGFDISPDITSLVYRTSLPGGFASLDVGLPNDNLPRQGILPRPARMTPHCRGVLYQGGRVVFEGRLMSGIGPNAMEGGQFVGYGLSALTDGYVSSSDATSDTAGDILRSVLSNSASLLQPGGSLVWQDTAVAHTLAEFNRRAPYAVVQQLAAEGGLGDLGNVIWDWLVYEDRIAQFVRRDQPSNPHYVIPFEGRPWIEWTENYEQMYSSAAVSYTASGVETDTAVAETSAFQARWGFSRSTLLTMGETTATGATTYRDTWLAMHAAPEYAVVVKRTDARGLELEGGGEYPACLVRAGEWVQVGLGEAADPMMIIVGTEYDASSGEGTYELGAPNRYAVDENAAQVCQETSYISNFLDPQTGTRTR